MISGLVSLLAIVVLALVVHRRTLARYPSAPPGLAVLNAGESAFVESVGEVLFPGGGAMALSGRESSLSQSIDRHLDALPRTQRTQIRLLFLLLEHLPLAWPGQEPGGRARFSPQSAAARVGFLERLAEHRFGLLRLLFTALRSVFVLAYVGHPANLHGLGLAPFSIDPAVSDAERLFPRIGAPALSRANRADAVTDPQAAGPLDPDGPRHPAYVRAARGAGGPS